MKAIVLPRSGTCFRLAAAALAAILCFAATQSELLARDADKLPADVAPTKAEGQSTQPFPAAPEEADYAALQVFAVFQEARIEALRTDVRRVRGEAKEAEAEDREEEIETLKDAIVSRYLGFAAKYPKNAQAYNELGLIIFDLGRPHDAATYWKRALARKPDYPEAHNNLGSYFSKFGSPEYALLEFDRAIELDPSKAVYHLNRATELYSSRDAAAYVYGWGLPRIYEEVMKEHRLARDLAPDDYSYARQYAETFAGAKFFGLAPDWDASIEAWKHCLKLKLTELERDQVFVNVARICILKDDKPAAREALSQIAQKDTQTYRILSQKAAGETAP